MIKTLQMYKVFVNEKKLTLSKYPEEIDKKLRFEGFATLEIAVDLLQNTSCPELNVYGENLEEIWEDFTHMFRVIESAGGVVRNKNGEILFIHRIGRWDLPKGKIEKGEYSADIFKEELIAMVTDLTKKVINGKIT